MLNVNKITSELSMMPDPALQQFAQMHKADPYMLSLAVAESNRRKDVRMAPQMAAGQPPKVAEQAIADMAPAPAPENIGIGRLPAQNMQRMASGGIVAFADGGETDDSAPWYMRPADETIPNIPELMGEQWRNFRRWQQINAGRAVGAKTPGEVRKTEPVERVPMPEGYKPGAGPIEEAAAAPEALAAPDTTEAAGISALVRGRARGTAPKISTPQYQEPPPPSYEEMSAAVRKGAGAANADTDTAFKLLADKLAAQEAEIKGHDNVKEALIRAGLGMMATKSPYAMQGIGGGAVEGFDTYQKAQEQDRAAQRSNMNAQMLLAQAQRAERSGNMRDATSLYGQYRSEVRDQQNAARHAAELKSTDEYRNADLQLRQQQIDQQGEYYRALGLSRTGNKDLQTLRAQQASIQAQLKTDPTMQYTNKDQFDALTSQLQAVTTAIAQQPGGATMPAAAAPIRSGWGQAVVK